MKKNIILVILSLIGIYLALRVAQWVLWYIWRSEPVVLSELQKNGGRSDDSAGSYRGTDQFNDTFDSTSEDQTSLDSLAMVPDRSTEIISADGPELEVEVVNTPASITLGLSGRSEIGRDGMLFVLPERRRASFWMKDMQFDLDLVWIDGDTIVGIQTVPAPKANQLTQDLPSYDPGVPVTHVLEVAANTADEKGLFLGSKIQLSK